ncbi:hypothetical protein Hypma_001452 [Hypsizygus marmoreus]|uniref:Protein kinase domain-containing protein n=1 Tax=Hypsizygus marmoreus TaxID=39966 RepID=A0A369K0W6_HYPMA|nr:hypothetical protein Hypma_001452 [Hypsizygus marmoreus]
MVLEPSPPLQGNHISRESAQGGLRAALDAVLHPPRLNSWEVIWRDRYEFFRERGLELRPRYRPDWSPSWLGTSISPSFCEDSIQQIVRNYLIEIDAKRKKDGKIVCLKRIKTRSDEVAIGQYFTSEHLKGPRNHCVPIWDSFHDPVLSEVDYIVMPVLRPYDDPEFRAVGEVVDFVTQLLEGLDFMHSHNVAHGDLAAANIMMDATPIYPQGWHFVLDSCAPNGIDLLVPLQRIDRPVRYFIVDFGLSLRFGPNQSHLVDGLGGRDPDPPELYSEEPSDAFKLDIFTLGNVFFKEFQEKYLELDFLAPLTSSMLERQFSDRPTAQLALQHWYSIKQTIDPSTGRWRLSKPNETITERFVLNTVAAAQQGMRNLKVMFQGDVLHSLDPSNKA